jgi:hypothetical protein
MGHALAAVAVGIFTACLAPLGCAPTTTPPAVVTCHVDADCGNVNPPTRLDITGTDAGPCADMGGDWNDDTLVCEGVDY